MPRGPIDMANGYSTSGGMLRRERYDSLPTTSPWDDSLPIGAEYPRHVRGVAAELPLDDENQSYEYTNDYRYSAGGTRIPRSGS